jgi:oligoribonuclease
MDEKAVEACALDFISRYVPAGKSPLCGNSIGQDRRFLARWMPDLERYMHYRNIDVSSFKEVVKRWAPEKLKEYRKSSRHEALADIYDSIEELKFYRSKVMTI